MKEFRIIFILSFIFAFSCYVSAQTTTKTVTQKTVINPAKSSPAYAEILLRKTELTAELENLLLDYTEEFPKVKELRFTLGLIQKDMNKVLAVTDVSKLTLALGKLIIRKVELQVDVWSLKLQYSDEHPEIKRAKKKVEVYEQAIKEILP
ncbi:hypothetical protein BH10ACI1_BH10ACI1_18410 [soil metagenome]